MPAPRTILELIDVGERVMSDSTAIFEDHDNRSESEQLMEHVLDSLLEDVDLESELPPRLRDRFLALVARRAAGEPLPVLVGWIEFDGVKMEVRPGSFIPRPSSEFTVDRAVQRLRRRKSPIVVDVCTGSGPIALAIAARLKSARVWGSDIDASGIKLARRNAKRLGIENVEFKVGDMYGALPDRLKGTVDLITGHVPYVPPGEIEDLPAEVREHEPIFTLTGESADGLALVRHAAIHAADWLKPGGWLLLELSEDFAKKVERIYRKNGIEPLGVAADEYKLSVVVEGRKPA